ncbi:hypothetical protein OE88DRAFT_1805579 [Heliocybe sulcata]|uniref:Uncharacterized protein n=1 Tax=Heliocybe sulcata TaxID=5364 RepID=A0A5C3NE88_9AGAM|nr:hypothetical protein OE88DRAFT_1805579 [Heliocybe sulcata]
MAGLPQKPSFDPNYPPPSPSSSRARYPDERDHRPPYRTPTPPRRAAAPPMSSERYRDARYERPREPRAMADSYVASAAYDGRRRDDERYRDDAYRRHYDSYAREPERYPREYDDRERGRADWERYGREFEERRREDDRRRWEATRREPDREPARTWEPRQDYERRYDYTREPRREDERVYARDTYEPDRRRRPSPLPRRTTPGNPADIPRAPHPDAPSPQPVPGAPALPPLAAHQLARDAQSHRRHQAGMPSRLMPTSVANATTTPTLSKELVKGRGAALASAAVHLAAGVEVDLAALSGRKRSGTVEAQDKPTTPKPEAVEPAMDVDVVKQEEPTSTVVPVPGSPAVKTELTEEQIPVAAPSPVKTEAPLPPTMDKGKAKAIIEDSNIPTGPRSTRVPPTGPRSSAPYMPTLTTPSQPIAPSPSPIKPSTPSLTVPPSPARETASPLMPVPSSLPSSVKHAPSPNPNASSPAVQGPPSLPSSMRSERVETKGRAGGPRKSGQGPDTPEEVGLPAFDKYNQNEWPAPLVKEWQLASVPFFSHTKRLAFLQKEYVEKSRAAKRAVHEWELATIDLRLAEERRKVADSQLEKARAGQLGIEYVKEVKDVEKA